MTHNFENTESWEEENVLQFKRCSVVPAMTIACCLIFWCKCSLRYNMTRKEIFVQPFQLRDIKNTTFCSSVAFS